MVFHFFQIMYAIIYYKNYRIYQISLKNINNFKKKIVLTELLHVLIFIPLATDGSPNFSSIYLPIVFLSEILIAYMQFRIHFLHLFINIERYKQICIYFFSVIYSSSKINLH